MSLWRSPISIGVEMSFFNLHMSFRCISTAFSRPVIHCGKLGWDWGPLGLGRAVWRHLYGVCHLFPFQQHWGYELQSLDQQQKLSVEICSHSVSPGTTWSTTLAEVPHTLISESNWPIMICQPLFFLLP